MKVEAGVFEVEAGADEKQQIKFVWPNAPINVSPHLPPPGAGWGIFLVWNGRFAPGVGILNR